MISKVLGLVAAKAGSKRFPRKNIALLRGKPLLEWTLDAARRSGVCDALAVSSEADEILDLAKTFGCDQLIKRPMELARDPAGIVDVALHALCALRAQGNIYNTIVLLAPCAPLRTAGDITEAFELYKKTAPDFVMSVSEFSHTPFSAMHINEQGSLLPVFSEYIGRKSQEMPAAYRPNGAIHVLDVKRFETERSYYVKPLRPFVMPIERSVDIDNPVDLEFAEALLRRQGAEGSKTLE